MPTSKDIHFHSDAQHAFHLATASTRADATPVLELLSTGFEITWFRESSPRLWLAAVKPTPQVREHFGLNLFGTAVHESDLHRSALKTVSASTAQRIFDKNKREFYNQILWTLDHLRRVAPDEEHLLRDLALGGARAYVELWSDNELRETFAYHLERYGLVRFDGEIPVVELTLIKQALQRPAANEFKEQKRQLKGLVEAIEAAIRSRLCADIERDRTSREAVEAAVNAIPSDAKNRPMGRTDLRDLGEMAGLSAVLEALNWGDYEILLNKFYESIEWIGDAMEKPARLATIKKLFVDAHLVRHNNDHKLNDLIREEGFAALFNRFCEVRDMLAA